ncbi:Repeat domain-containing protein [Lentzea albida]|uniref:Repeat domain-containing protein n=1 Tax=Lentzea albida TaxID=65499 RepID=A0A1H9F4H3_9PSEU|nr:Repeat domain-containing protein [Lentzea albida]
MNRRRRRLFSIASLLTLLASLLVSIPASALGNDYPWPSANMNQLSPLRFNYRNCTDYAAWTLNRQLGGSTSDIRFNWNSIQANNSGHARDWRQGAINRGKPVNDTPRRGAVAWWGASHGGGYGHVAMVAEVRDGGNTVVVHEYNRSNTGVFGTRALTRSNGWPEAFLHIADLPGADVSGDGRADLVLVATGPTGSGRTEAHVLDAATGYSTWYSHWATAAGYTSAASDKHLVGDVNGDGRSDLVIVGTGPTGSGRMEAHVLDGATGYSTWLAHWATAAGYGNSSTRYGLGDVNGDGRADLVLIGTGPTGSGRTEAHVLDAATGYSTWLANWATAAGYSGAPTDRHLVGDVNGDGRADLVIVGTGPTGSGRTEAHVLDAATGYSTWIAHWPTAAGYSGGDNDRHVLGDVNGDGRADLVIVGTGPTGSGRTEAHVLDAATGYSTWIAHWPTAAGYGDATLRYAL